MSVKPHRSTWVVMMAMAAGWQLFAVASGASARSSDAVGAGGIAVQNPTAMTPALRQLLDAYPGARYHSEGERVRIVYGAPMTAGETARSAAERWLIAHSAVFGTAELDVEELWVTPVMNGRFTAIAYRQYIEGLPVEYGNIRILVRSAGGGEMLPRVVYAAATLAEPLAPARMQLNIDGDTARRVVQSMALFRALPEWSEPELAVYTGDGRRTDAKVAWRFTGGHLDAVPPIMKTFFVDAATGRLLDTRNEVYRSEITGTVKGWATPGVLPDGPGNAPTLQAVGEIRARVLWPGGASAFATRTGAYSIVHQGSSSVPVATGVSAQAGYGGRWVDVAPTDANPLQATQFATAPATVDFVLNPPPHAGSGSLTAQLNAFIGVTLAHNHVRDRAPDFSLLDIPLHVRTGEPGACDAYFHPGLPMLRFLNAGNGCPNTAYSSVIAHEYGHFVVNRLNLGQGGFGEGYGDTLAMLIYDDTGVGRDFYGAGTALRDPPSANVQYPCAETGPNSGIHYCGQILAGTWWGIRSNLGTLYGSEPGLDTARDMQVAWSLITTGGTGLGFRQSAHPGTAIEVLTIDDDDGYIGNGTPHWDEICAAFAAHGIDCPDLDPIDIEFPQGIPEWIPPAQVTAFPVNIIPLTGTGQPSGVRLYYRVKQSGSGTGAFSEGQVVQIGPDQYIATLPAVSCGAFIDFYITADAAGGTAVTRPPAAPDVSFTARALAGAIETVAFDDDFETDQGWTVWNDPSMPVPGGGNWERATPIGSHFANQPVQPGAAHRGQYCFVTENGEHGAAANAHDVDWGPTVLTSPRIDITGADFADLSFAWWHYTLNGVPDVLEVDVSADDGLTWVRLAEFGNASEPRRGQWNRARFDLLEHIDATTSLRVRFTVDDTPNDSLTESAIDDVRVTLWTCPPGDCYADCDESGALNIDDFICFINAFAAQDPYADCDGSGALNIDDFICFINEFAAGCP